MRLVYFKIIVATVATTQLKEDVKQQEQDYDTTVQKTMQDCQKYNEAKVKGR